jgi:hypothetical protein
MGCGRTATEREWDERTPGGAVSACETHSVPVTYFAHQAPVLGLKTARPSWVDGTAICVGSMAPDWSYALGRDWMPIPSHSMAGSVVWALPVAVAVTLVVRNRAAAIAAHLPDLGPFRLRSYGVLGTRRPAWWLTVLCAWIGAVSHVAIDSFTHIYRRGSNLLGLNDVAFHLGGRRILEAEVLQWFGHLGGTAGSVVLLWLIGRRRLLDAWYGADAVARVRRAETSAPERAGIALGALTGLFLAAAWSAMSGAALRFAGPLGVAGGTMAASWLMAWLSARDGTVSAASMLAARTVRVRTED